VCWWDHGTHFQELPSTMSNGHNDTVACATGEASTCTNPECSTPGTEYGAAGSLLPIFPDVFGLANLFGYCNDEDGHLETSAHSVALTDESKSDMSDSESTSAGSDTSKDTISVKADSVLEWHADAEAALVAESDCSSTSPEADDIVISESSSFWFVSLFSSTPSCSSEKARDKTMNNSKCVASSCAHVDGLQVDQICDMTVHPIETPVREQESVLSIQQGSISDIMVVLLALVNSTAVVGIVCLAIVP